VNTLTRHRLLHVPTIWLVLLITFLLAVAVQLAAAGLQRAAAGEPSGAGRPHPAMSGEFAKLPFA
jgi:hypothetical protein